MLSNLLLATLLGGAFAAPTGDLVVHEKRSVLHSGGRQRVDPTAVLPVRIALAQSNLDKGYDFLLDVSDPHSGRYGKHWTTEEIHATFAPSTDSVDAVTTWLEVHGFHVEHIASSTSGGWLGVDMPVRDVERLFSTEYYEQLDVNDNTVVACDEYSLPSHLTAHIDYVTPGVMASPPVKKKRTTRSLSPHLAARSTATKIPDISPYNTSTCGEWITPACLKALYGIPDATLNQTENILGVFAAGNVYDQPDLDAYFSNYAPWVPNGTHPHLISINGAKAPVPQKIGGGESTVDFDLSLSLLYPQAVTLYQVQTSKSQREQYIKDFGPQVNTTELIVPAFYPFLAALDGAFCTDKERHDGTDCGTIELTNVLSASYGDSELQTPDRAAKRICSELMKLSLKGHTLLFASQDYGPGESPAALSDPKLPLANGCIKPSLIENATVNGTVFSPTFPASCPFITAVGATKLDQNQVIGDPESAMFDHRLSTYPDLYTVSSGGGVSNYFDVPDYQKCAYDDYFSKYGPSYPTYNYTGRSSVGADGGIRALGGRGIPDIAANGQNMAIYVEGAFVTTGEAGTSLATPIIASMITLINQQRTLAGKGPVGFINPVLYKNPQMFTDITRGSAPGCNTDGYPVSPGWDPVTGLGTPIYSKMLEVFMNLP